MYCLYLNSFRVKIDAGVPKSLYMRMFSENIILKGGIGYVKNEKNHGLL